MASPDKKKKLENVNVMKGIVATKKELQDCQNLDQLLRIENFELTVKCNRMKNVLSNINTIEKALPGQLLDYTTQVTQILRTCAHVESCAPYKVQNGKISVNKPKAELNPHTVNGHILYVPTINLTRINESPNNNSKRKFSESDDLEDSQVSSSSRVNNSMRSDTATSINAMDFMGDSQLVSSVESQPSTSSQSASHTLLSGTFQEVKIYLNPVTEEMLNRTRNGVIDNCSRNVTKRTRR